MDQLVRALALAICDSIDCMRDQDRAGGLAGYALVTDADLRTVYGASVSREDVQKEGDDALVFMPVDWTAEHHSASFELASEQLERASGPDSGQAYDERVLSAGASFISALQRARSERSALREAVLVVTCADGGGDTWSSVERQAIRDLNDAATYDRWAVEMDG